MKIIASSRGWSLIEMLVILIILGVLSSIAAPQIFKALRSENQVKTAATNLIADLKYAENEAIRIGGGDVMDTAGTGAFSMTKKSVFVAFTVGSNAYRVSGYADTNGNNQRDNADTITKVINSKSLANRVTFGILPSVNKTACYNSVNNAPTAFVSFPADGNPPCDGDLCLEFDSNGFPKFSGATTSGAIYLTNTIDAYAVSINAAGLTTLCKWDGTQWQLAH